MMARGERDALALPTRQREATLADHGVVAVRQFDDELVRFGRSGRGLDLDVGDVGPSVGDVGPHRVGEQEALLEHDADLPAQRVEGDVAHVDAVDRHSALGHVVEARQEQRDGRLARSARADERDGLARCDVQLEAVENGLALRVAEAHVVEVDVAA